MIPLHCLTLQSCCKQTKSQFSLCFFHYRMDLSWSKVNKVKYFKALLWLLLLLYYCRLLLLNYFICWHKLNYLVRINHRIMVYTNVAWRCTRRIIQHLLLRQERRNIFHFWIDVHDNPELRQRWIRFINRADWKPTKHSRICENHFEEKFLRRDKRLRLVSKELNPVPTIYPFINSTYAPGDIAKTTYITSLPREPIEKLYR